MSSNCSKFFEYMRLIGQLKQVERTGWVRKGVKNPESVAEHSYRMAMAAFALPRNSNLDKDKCIKIALVHDMAESIVGDLTPWCGVSKEEKSKKEKEATTHITSLVPDEAGKEMYQLWLEYENQSSPEAQFVKDLDKFEMLVQAYEYEDLQSKPRSLQEFFDHTLEKYKFATEHVKKWMEELILHRDKSKPLDPLKSVGSADKQGAQSPLIKKRKLDINPEDSIH
ncbi:HD domain-containing protein 2 [Biomphalaria pfeifferi]|uniref:5'-deoxynucleotidase HDDC2 n=1 Tax=Biomphalaria pfeifferi TaxID=112525 RepID=A0AAD8BHL4_BIOPF|nr:HD domain-containing protein 2 [Biomphalaria pfeifferi]